MLIRRSRDRRLRHGRGNVDRRDRGFALKRYDYILLAAVLVLAGLGGALVFSLSRDADRLGRPGDSLVEVARAPGLAVSGRVLNRRGEPVPGVEVVARSYLPAPSPGAVDRPTQQERSSRSNQDGVYEIRELAAGEYEIRTVATARYPSVSIVVRAGVHSADILLSERQQLRVHGTVTNERGERLRGVRVVPLLKEARETRTNGEGTYDISLLLNEKQRTCSLRFLAEGYQEKRVTVGGADFEGAAETRLDVRLEALGETTLVVGSLRSDAGRPIPGETIQLMSAAPAVSYQAVTDETGTFSIPGVKIDSEYSLVVRPRALYKDYWRHPVVPTRGEFFLDIILETVATARLTGRIVDAERNPLPRFRLWLGSAASKSSSLEVRSDDGGYFVVEAAPEGNLVFESRSEPQIRVGGFRVTAGEEQDVLLVIDWGEHALTGRVIDDRDNPIAGSRVTLGWVYRDGAVYSAATRSTTTDSDGFFRFTQLGRGTHRINVSSPGYKNAWQDHEVGRAGEAEVRLEPIPR